MIKYYFCLQVYTEEHSSSLTHWLANFLAHSFTGPPATCSPAHLLTHLLTHSLKSINQSITQSLTHSLTQTFCQSNNQSNTRIKSNAESNQTLSLTCISCAPTPVPVLVHVQVHCIGWEDCVRDHFQIHCHVGCLTLSSEGFISVSGEWDLFCQELTMAEGFVCFIA